MIPKILARPIAVAIEGPHVKYRIEGFSARYKICEFCDCKFIHKNTLLTAFKFFVVTDNRCFMQYVNVKIYTRRVVFSKEHITNGGDLSQHVSKNDGTLQHGNGKGIVIMMPLR